MSDKVRETILVTRNGFKLTYARREQNKPIRNHPQVEDWTIRSRLQKMSAKYKFKHSGYIGILERGALYQLLRYKVTRMNFLCLRPGQFIKERTNRNRSKANFSSHYQNIVRWTGVEKKEKLGSVANSYLVELANS